MDRPGATFTAARGKAALTFSSRRLPESAAPKLALKRPPAWVFLHGTRSSLSSTELRRHAAKP
jgi:nicotinate-nucleotide adenylyltransferase